MTPSTSRRRAAAEKPVAPKMKSVSKAKAKAAEVETETPARADDVEAAEAPAPASGRLIEHELTGLFAEAYEAYDMQAERVRFDSEGRRWVFRPGVNGNNSQLELEVHEPPTEEEPDGSSARDAISTHLLGSDLGRDFVEASVRALDLR